MKLTLFPPSDDFFTDRLCRRYGIAVFVIVAMVMHGAYISPWAFSCWTPAHFSGSHQYHSSHMCWNKGTFHKVMAAGDVPIHRENYDSELMFNLNRMRYIPLVLILQSLLFLLPRLIWKAITTITNFPTARLVASTQHVVHGVSKESTIDTHGSLSSIAAKFMASIQNPFPVLGSTVSSIGGYLLSLSYIICKLCYSAVCILQIVIISKFLGINFFAFGFGRPLGEEYITYKITKTANTTEFLAEPLFPRTVLCDFQIRQLGNAQRYTVQCEISANELVERAFLVLWLWIWLSLILLSISTLMWMLRILFYILAPLSYKTKRVLVYLGQPPTKHEAHRRFDKKEVSSFARQLLKPDGSLVLEMLEDNVSLAAAAEVVRAAWAIYQEQGQGQVVQHETMHFQQPAATTVQAGRLKDGEARDQRGPSAIHGVYPELSCSADASQLENIPLVEKTEF